MTVMEIEKAAMVEGVAESEKRIAKLCYDLAICKMTLAVNKEKFSSFFLTTMNELNSELELIKTHFTFPYHYLLYRGFDDYALIKIKEEIQKGEDFTPEMTAIYLTIAFISFAVNVLNLSEFISTVSVIVLLAPCFEDSDFTAVGDEMVQAHNGFVALRKNSKADLIATFISLNNGAVESDSGVEV